MNITQGSVHNWLNAASYNNDSKNNSINGNTTSSNNNNSINGNTTSSNNNQSSPSPQLWDLRWFGLLSGPLLFGTIIIPLITGPAIRYLCRSYVTLRVYWRLGFVLLAIAYPVLFYNFLSVSDDDGENNWILWGGIGLIIISDTSLSLFVLFQAFSAWRFKRRRRLWTSCVFLALMVWLLDFHLIPSGRVLVPFGYSGWICILTILLVGYRRKSIAKRRADIRTS